MWKIYVLRSDTHLVKYAKTRASFDEYFLNYDSALIQENTDTILSMYGKTSIKKITHFGVFYTVIH